jgi:hypothetical protein
MQEVRKAEDPIPFSLAALGEERPQPKTFERDRARPVAEAAVPQQVNVDGMKLLIGMAFAICLVSLFIWAFVRHLLFAR